MELLIYLSYAILRNEPRYQELLRRLKLPTGDQKNSSVCHELPPVPRHD